MWLLEFALNFLSLDDLKLESIINGENAKKTQWNHLTQTHKAWSELTFEITVRITFFAGE